MKRVWSEQKKITYASDEKIEAYIGLKKYNEAKGRYDITDKLAAVYPCKMGTKR